MRKSVALSNSDGSGRKKSGSGRARASQNISGRARAFRIFLRAFSGLEKRVRAFLLSGSVFLLSRNKAAFLRLLTHF